MTPATSREIFEIFVSYSHRDDKVVKPLVQLLRPTGATIFRDEDAIPPGKQWEVVVTKAVQACRLVYVFWCNHSATSPEVRKEYEQAISLDKDIVPVLLDDTALPTNLKAYQWVDLRDVIGKHEEAVEQVISLEEGIERQRLDREAHGYGKNVHGYFGGDFARQGWVERQGKYIRKLTVERNVPDAALRRAAELLSAEIEHHIK